MTSASAIIPDDIDWAVVIRAAASAAWGEPNASLSNAHELRFGKHGSKAIDLNAATWFDFEACVGGGALDLIEKTHNLTREEALQWAQRVVGAVASPRAPRSTTPQRIVEQYDYCDDLGNLIYQQVRFEPKGFRQRRRGPDGQWIWNTEGCPQFLYRLPDVLGALSAGRAIFIAEGEKDVETLWSHEIPATCGAMGAGGAARWKAGVYDEWLKGRRVAVLFDNDAAGRNLALAIFNSCLQVCSAVRIVDLCAVAMPQWPFPRCDVSDWFEFGGTTERLFELAKASPVLHTIEEARTALGLAPETKARNANADDSKLFPKMDDAAYHGLAGDVVRAIEPHTEADPVAILIQALADFGNAVGRNAHYRVEADFHRGNMFIVLVGDTAKARKGTSGSRVRALFEDALDGDCWLDRIKSGLSSGEGLINAVRDKVERWDAKEKSFETVDPGVTDKRLLIVESEFANALAVMERCGNTLSPVLRNAWDGRGLETLTKSAPLKASGAHVSVVAHITEDELRTRLTRTDATSGFANRFLFVCVKRSKALPFGGEDLDADMLHGLCERLAGAITFARATGRVQMTPAARDVWATIYTNLSDAQPGLLGAIVARAEAQVVRLALLYALLHERAEIDVDHLKAALAVWEYAEASAVRIFGDALGDPVADEIWRALQQAGTGGMTRSALHDLFGRNKNADRISTALGLLVSKGRARAELRKTGGRPVELWLAIHRDG